MKSTPTKSKAPADKDWNDVKWLLPTATADLSAARDWVTLKNKNSTATKWAHVEWTAPFKCAAAKGTAAKWAELKWNAALSSCSPE